MNESKHKTDAYPDPKVVNTGEILTEEQIDNLVIYLRVLITLAETNDML